MRQKQAKDYLLGRSFQRFLESNVGRPWDTVYSRICEIADNCSDVGRDLRKRLDWMVETSGFYIDSEGVARSLKYGYNHPLRNMYVDPKTGILCAPPKDKGNYRRVRPDEQEIDLIILDDYRSYEKIEGIWYYLWLEEKEDTYPGNLVEDEKGIHYNVNLIKRHIPHKKQLSKEEIKNLKDLFHLGINKNYMRRIGYDRSSKYQNWKVYFKTWGLGKEVNVK
jgi:hypothetical protein